MNKHVTTYVVFDTNVTDIYSCINGSKKLAGRLRIFFNETLYNAEMCSKIFDILDHLNRYVDAVNNESV